MSYYSSYKFSCTPHAIVRIKQRIKKLKNTENYQLCVYINQLLNKISFEFDDHKCEYYRYPYSDLYDYYFVVDKNSKTIITFTKISHAKKLYGQNRTN